MSASATKPNNSGHKWLFIAGGVAILLAVIFFRRNTSVELMQFGGLGLFAVPAEWPSNSTEWFALFQHDRTVALLLFDFADIVNYALVGLAFAVLYVALRAVNRSVMLLALVSGMIGVAVYFASNQAFAMANLSRRFAETMGELEQAALIAAGEALLAVHNPSDLYQGVGITLSLLLVSLSGLLIALVMLRSADFSKLTAWFGILANGIMLTIIVVLPLAPALSWLPYSASAIFRVIWYVLIAISLFRLARRQT